LENPRSGIDERTASKSQYQPGRTTYLKRRISLIPEGRTTYMKGSFQPEIIMGTPELKLIFHAHFHEVKSS
jgi:hypothetical protein